MDFTNIIALLGGLSLFLYGMQMMGAGLEAAAGNKMKKILEKLTSNPLLGVLVGAAITALVQSSSATTVMIVGFVNSGLMTLSQAVWLIMGANIGTTVTGLMIALDVGEMAPIFAFIGVVLIVFLKNPKIHNYGKILAGLGILFIGMDMMSGAMLPLRESEEFVSLMTKFENPLLGILVGMVFTAIIQSSSASIGILQTLAAGGLITLPSAVFVLFGQNIGTCVTAVLASIGTSRSAKRTTLVHLFFNVIGTVVFTAICIITPFTDMMMEFFPGDPSLQIANTHVVFNITTTLLLLPFGNLLAKVVTKILPEHESELTDTQSLRFIKSVDTIKDRGVGNTAVAIHDSGRELERMAAMVKKTLEGSFDTILTRDTAKMKNVLDTEDYVDYLNKEISKYLSHHMASVLNEEDSVRMASFFKITSNLERISDHAVNICEYTTMLEEKKITFSNLAMDEIRKMKDISVSTMDSILSLEHASVELLADVAALEQKMDDMTGEFRENQLERMQSGVCSGEACVIYSELLTDFERIGDHILNIAKCLAA